MSKISEVVTNQWDGHLAKNIPSTEAYDVGITALQSFKAPILTDDKEQYNSSNYVAAVTRSESISPLIGERLSNTGTQRLLHAGMGLCTEAGEFVDSLKKTIFYGKELDKVNAIEELGDICWYLGLACDELGVSLNTVLSQNIAKLKLRYPEKFTEEAALVRDLNAERVLLESTYIEPGILSEEI